MSANIASVDEESLKSDLRELVRKTVQETLNALLDEEADETVGAGRYERTAAREAYRSGRYKRKLVTTSGEVVLDVPKLRGATFQTAVIERDRRRETSVEEAIIEMYLASVSTGPTPPSLWATGRSRPSPGLGRRGPGAPWCGNASRGYVSQTRRRTPGALDVGR